MPPSRSGYLRYLAFWPNPAASFTLADVRFTDAEFARLNRLGNAIYNANTASLHAFAAHGGKLILYHGWADQAISPWSTLDYYAAVERTSGGFRASQAFSRLYLIPGAYHCLYAPDGSINLADFLTPLIAWVQHGTAPGTVSADTLSLTTFKITMPPEGQALQRPRPGHARPGQPERPLPLPRHLPSLTGLGSPGGEPLAMLSP